MGDPQVKYKHGANFLLKKISFDAKSSPCYIASNLKLCVDLKNTCLEACDDDTSIPASIGWATAWNQRAPGDFFTDGF